MRISLFRTLALTMAVGGLTALSLAQSTHEHSSSRSAASKRPAKPAPQDLDPSGLPPAPPATANNWIGAPAEQVGPYTLTLGEMRFDPQVDMPLPPPGWDESLDDANGRNLRLVQFDGPTQQLWLDQLAAADVEVVQYIHPYTYIVWGDAAGQAVTSTLPAARWTGEFIPAYRVLPPYRNLAEQPLDVRFVFYRGADIDSAIRMIRELGAQFMDTQPIDQILQTANFNMPGNLIQEAAKIPGVYSIRPIPTDGGLRGEMTNQLNVGNYDGTNLAFPGYAAYLSGAGVDGNGVIIANVDGGVQATHPDLVNRMLGCVGTTCSTGDSSHGTHTAGIMAADGSSGTTANGGFLRGQGVAPGANLFEQQYSPFFTQAGGMLLIMTDSYNNGASLSGNSWGPAGTPQGYDDDTRQVDVGVRDADPGAAGNQPLTFVLSFMNGNGGTSSQGSPDEGKNLFNIGSTKGQNSGSGSQILQIDDVSSNSAHGPALDGRTIPHMVAPGCYVDSSITTNTWGLNCGTSMASPHVSGAVALFIEYYRGLPGYTADPSPALVKAAFLPVCYDLDGNSDADGGTLGHPFDSKQGWGRMNLDNVINSDPNGIRYFDNPVTFDNTAEEWSVTVSPLNPAEPMRIMLVWTDAPGHGLGGSTPAWNNDLDLIVEAGGTYRGNNFGASGFSDVGGAADARNNTEGVFLGPTPPGGATIRVVATNINSDGVPNSGDGTDQDFSLVCYNCAEEPGFILAADPTSATICAPTIVEYDIDVTQVLGFTDPITLSANNVPVGASVSFSANPVVAPTSVTLTIDDTDLAAAGNYIIEVEGVSGAITRTVNVGLDISQAAPGTPTLTAPSNGASGVGLAPTYTWNAIASAATYDIDVATDAGFSNIVDSATVAGPSHTSGVALSSLTTYFWRVRGSNACGDGSYASASFTTLEAPSILVVDDDDNSPNMMANYDATLAAMGLTYDVWNTNNSDNEPDALTLAQYNIVIWFTGDEFGGVCGPGSAGETALGNWLDTGRCLFMSSQDYHYDRNLTSFMQNYLGIGSVVNDQAQSSATGAGLYTGFGPYSLSYPFTNYSDVVNPGGSGILSFSGNVGNVGVQQDTGTYRTVFLGYPLEAISDVNNRAAVLVKFIEWCDELFPDTCLADIADSTSTNPDGLVNVFDLLELLDNWGTSGNGAGIAAPTNVVDVFDLLALLDAWGDC